MYLLSYGINDEAINICFHSIALKMKEALPFELDLSRMTRSSTSIMSISTWLNHKWWLCLTLVMSLFQWWTGSWSVSGKLWQSWKSQWEIYLLPWQLFVDTHTLTCAHTAHTHHSFLSHTSQLYITTTRDICLKQDVSDHSWACHQGRNGSSKSVGEKRSSLCVPFFPAHSSGPRPAQEQTGHQTPGNW